MSAAHSTPYFELNKAIRVSTCRACTKKIEPGNYRVLVAYPDKEVQYRERTGYPSFFMHPRCFIEKPVDYVKTGLGAWQRWEPRTEPFLISNESLQEIRKRL